MKKEIELLSTLLRELEDDVGTSDLFFIILNSLRDSLRSFRPKNAKDFHEQFSSLVNVFCNTKPKFGLFLYYFQELRYEFDKLPDNADFGEFFDIQIKKIKDNELKNKESILEFSDRINVEGKSLLIYEQSHTVQAVLERFKAQGKKFSVIVAEQEYEKTHSIIEFLHEQKIPFQVVPDYMLSHIGNSVDMVFFGALTLKNSMDFVMPTGSHGVISEFNTMEIPCYVFLQTPKFSLWESEIKKEIYHRKETRCHYCKPINYERLKFSHDRVETSLFHKIITEEGIYTPEELKKVFDKKFKEFQRKEEKMK